jgi:hypothetical protein
MMILHVSAAASGFGLKNYGKGKNMKICECSDTINIGIHHDLFVPEGCPFVP